MNFIALIKSEPILFQALIQTGIAMFMAFGLGITVEQMGAVMAFTAAVCAFIARAQVTPNHIVSDMVEVALNTPPPPNSDKSPMDLLKKETPGNG